MFSKSDELCHYALPGTSVSEKLTKANMKSTAKFVGVTLLKCQRLQDLHRRADKPPAKRNNDFPLLVIASDVAVRVR